LVEDRRVAPNVIVVERGKSGRGGRRNRVEDSEKSIAIAFGVTQDQTVIVEVVAGIHADTGGKTTTHVDFKVRIEERDFYPVNFFFMRADDVEAIFCRFRN